MPKSEAKQARRGRPATGKRRPHRIPLDVSDEERDAMRAAAGPTGKSLVAWIRDLALAAAGYTPQA